MPYQITGKRANAEISTPMTATWEKNTIIWETNRISHYIHGSHWCLNTWSSLASPFVNK